MVYTKTRDLLIVDSEQNVRDFYRRVLERGGYSVDEACDGKEAFRSVCRRYDEKKEEMRRSGNQIPQQLRPYDLALTALRMPDWDGVDFILSSSLVVPEQKILVIDYNLTEDNIKEIEGEGNVVGWIEKPVDGDNLLRLVRTAIDVGSRI